MKFQENRIIEDVSAYIKSTYGEHYAGQNGIQTVDFWQSLGTLDTTSRDMAIKYLARYGKKDGYNKKDLYKAIHFIVLMIFELERKTDTHVDAISDFQNQIARNLEYEAKLSRTEVEWLESPVEFNLEGVPEDYPDEPPVILPPDEPVPLSDTEIFDLVLQAQAQAQEQVTENMNYEQLVAFHSEDNTVNDSHSEPTIELNTNKRSATGRTAKRG